MRQLYILIKELGNIEQISVTESLASLLWRAEFGLSSIDSRDMRIRNLPFNYDVYETSLDNYRKLSDLAVSYEKMDKAISHYQNRYSTRLVNYIIGDKNTIIQNLSENLPTGQAMIDVETVPTLVFHRLKSYFVDSFLIKDVQLSTEKHANIKYIDDTAEFRIHFTVLDVALPNDKGGYEKTPVVCEIFGRYQQEFRFDFSQIKTDKDRYFGYDEQLYDKRQAYMELIISRCKDKLDESLESCLKKVATEFIYDFYLE